ncbi:MAG: hypothetical protein ACR2JB_18475 [Bryobacteraceae bacterium]
MKDIQLLDYLQPELVSLEKVNYFPRQLLTVDDMVTERDYMLQKMRRHNRFLHGWGVVCGLIVTAAPTAELPWRVQISGGYALGPYGDEIYVVEPSFLDLTKCGPKAMTDPCNPGRLRPAVSGEGGAIYVAIKYAECLSRPVRAMAADCGCDDEPCEYSRIRDSFQITCLKELPPSHKPPRQPSICDIVSGKVLPTCPPCPESPWVVLAQVKLPASPTSQLANDNIDNRGVRRLLFSVSMIQDQLINCCCGDKSHDDPNTPPPPTNPIADVGVAFKESRIITLPGLTAVGSRALEFSLVVDNTGPSPATNVVVEVQTSPLMDKAQYAWVPSPDWLPIGGDPKNGIQANLGILAAGTSKTLVFTAIIVKRVPMEAKATVTAATADPNPANNTASRTQAIE